MTIRTTTPLGVGELLCTYAAATAARSFSPQMSLINSKLTKHVLRQNLVISFLLDRHILSDSYHSNEKGVHTKTSD